MTTAPPPPPARIRHGIDLVHVSRLREVMEGSPVFEERVFTAGERAYCRARPDPFPHFAARFAAKEAVLKAFGRGLSTEGPDGWLLDLEVVRRHGAPTLVGHGAAGRRLRRAAGSPPVLSLSHAGDYAIASVVWTEETPR